ncbi:AIPR protein [uncultured Blautia sp.]|nr:AIPR protein [uncultured Blautia sp.]
MNYTADFQARSDLTEKYGNNALLLYALQLRFEISDVVSVASDALTDGGDDKKCDLIYVDEDTGVAVVAQGYMKQTPKETDLAPGNKASDLNTAAAWVFAQNPDDVPERIREQVRLLQSSIESNSVSTIYFWYVHNLNEQNNPQIKEELTAMQASARALLKTLFPQNEVEIFAVEVGNETIEKWYNASSKQITVTDILEVDTPKVGFELIADKWKAYVTAVSAKWLQQQYATYKDDIFSGNPRTYLGSGKKKNKINLGIMETIDQQPGNFWAYNNGITALVNDYTLPSDNGRNVLSICGITIINGAQTTGAISSVEALKDAWVPIRFIVCNDVNIIDDIISNNNKQNEILPSDLRSNDKTQNRLREEFAPYTKLYYSGGRRGNVRPSRSKEILDPFVVAQALLAFHGDCVTAYNSKNELWSNDHLYSSIFPENLTAKHIIFTYSLARSIDSYKLELQQKADNRTDSEEKQHKYLSKRGSKMLFLYTVSRCMEGVIGKKIRDNWALNFQDNSDFDTLVQLWKTVLKSILPMACASLEPVLNDGLKSKDASVSAADTVVGLLTSVQEMIQSQLSVFVNAVND